MQFAAFVKQARGVSGRRREETIADQKDERTEGGFTKAWAHAGWENVLQISHEWLENMKLKT